MTYTYKASFNISGLTENEKKIYNTWRNALRKYNKDHIITTAPMKLMFLTSLSDRNNNKRPQVTRVIKATIMWLQDEENEIEYMSKKDINKFMAISGKLATNSRVKLIKFYIPEPLDKRNWAPGVRYDIIIN